MSQIQQQIVQLLQTAVDRAKPAGMELAYHPVIADEQDKSAFTTVHVVMADGKPVDDTFDFHAVARALGERAKAKVEERKVYSQHPPVPYKVITGTAGAWPFEIVFLLNTPG